MPNITALSGETLHILKTEENETGLSLLKKITALEPEHYKFLVRHSDNNSKNTRQIACNFQLVYKGQIIDPTDQNTTYTFEEKEIIQLTMQPQIFDALQGLYFELNPERLFRLEQHPELMENSDIVILSNQTR